MQQLSQWRGVSKLALAGIALTLGGCFTAENDEGNPIIPDAQLAYPLKPGDGRECAERSDGQDCSRATIARLPSGGYQFSTYSVDEDGKESGPSTEKFRLRPLRGGNIPANTYLAQSIDNDPDQRFLGLLARRADGGWVKISPKCENLSPTGFVNFMTSGWITTDSRKVSGMRCQVRRNGLDDARLYAILDEGEKDSSPTVIYDGS